MKKILSILLACAMLLGCVSMASAEEKTYTIGILQLMQHAALDQATKGFRDALTEKLGDKVVFDEQNAQGDVAQCATIATGFVANGYDLLMGNATPALQALMNATMTIPVLGTSVTDYATALSVESVAGGTGFNVSGTSDGVSAQLYADCVMELVPDAKKVGVFYCSAEPNSVVQADNFIAVMEEKGVECVVATFSDSNDMQIVLTGLVDGIDALYIPTDNTAASNMTIVANVCEPIKLPVITGEESMMSVGGLATVSITYYDIGYLTGEMAYDILVNGADISTMEIQYSPKAVKEYNPEFAEAIGFTMPDDYAAYQAAE